MICIIKAKGRRFVAPLFQLGGLLCIRGGSYLSSVDYLESTLRGVSTYRGAIPPGVISGLRMIMRHKS